jgi:RNA polymerase sigma-70 factor (ECF subfamily)
MHPTTTLAAYSPKTSDSAIDAFMSAFTLNLPWFSFAESASPPNRARDGGPVLRLEGSSAGRGSPPDRDRELVAAMARREERAAAAVYDRYAPMLMAVAFRITRSSADAEEIVLDTLEQAWRQADRFEESRGSVSTWLAMMARSRAFDFARKQSRQARYDAGVTDEALREIADTSSSALAMAEVGEASERRAHVTRALAALPAPQREAVELAFYDGLSHSEVAERLREPLGTVKTRIRLGMLKLRDLLQPLAPEVSP